MFFDNNIKFPLKFIFIILSIKIIFSSKFSENNIKKQLLRFIKYNKKENNVNENINLKPIEEYVNLINNNQLQQVYYNHDFNIPKISFISPVFNKDKYIRPLITSIQHQYINEFEIIFIDDCSTDDSIKIINDFSIHDKRIKLIKNKENKGTLYSRVQGALHSKGEYIIFIDSDDLVLQKGLYNSYNYIKKSHLSMVQFNTIFKRNETLNFNNRYYFYENIIRQPILSYIFYFNEKTENGDELNTALWDKLIERSIVLKTINFIGQEYYNENIKIENDVILLFSLFQISDSYQYINETGYFYVRTNNDSITNNYKNLKMSSLIIHGLFVNINFLYEKTRNSYIDKLFCLFKLQQSFKRYTSCFVKAYKEYYFIKKILKKLLSSTYIIKADKNIISIIDKSITLFYFKKISRKESFI